MECKLSILIPTTEDRKECTSQLLKEISRQSGGSKLQYYNGSVRVMIMNEPIEILIYLDNYEKSIGEKRNILLSKASGTYVSFVDSDDVLSKNYIQSLFEGINKGVDCCSLRGVITFDGVNPETFEHSIKYNEWKTNETAPIKYERTINHLNCLKKEIAEQFKFPEINFGEDHKWSMDLHQSGLIKTEHFIEEVIYHYQYLTKK